MNEHQFQEFCKVKGLRLVDRKVLNDGEIYVAETDLEKPTKDHPWGFYQVFWAIRNKNAKGKFDFGQWINFDAMHNPELDSRQKQQARINKAISDAKKILCLVK